MTAGPTVGEEGAVAPLDEWHDHIRGPVDARVVLEYGDYECPYSKEAFRQIQVLERELPGGVRFVFRHFPLADVHPHALAAAGAAEAAALQGRFWEMHEDLFEHQAALTEDDLGVYVVELGLDRGLFDLDRQGSYVARRVARDVRSGEDSGLVKTTPTLFIDGAVYRGSYDATQLLDVLGTLR